MTETTQNNCKRLNKRIWQQQKHETMPLSGIVPLTSCEKSCFTKLRMIDYFNNNIELHQ